MRKYGSALLVGGALALAACSGSNGAAGAPGANGSNGTNGTNGTNGVTGKLSLKIDSVVTANNVATLTFTISPAAAVCPGGVCDSNLDTKKAGAVVGQTTFYAQEYNSATNTFDTAKNFSFGSIAFKGISADGNGAQYTATKSNPPFTVETSPSAYVYAYVTGLSATPAPTTGHYYLPSSVASAAKVFGTIGYTSKANVAGCEKCHGAPYSKHGYRQAVVTGLPDFASCKACHTDQRKGSDAQWYALADDPAALTADPNFADTALRNKYAYTANIMNDVHNSHAFEFDYPQSMSNCVTCHAGKLDQVINDAQFKPSTCKSCHPVTGVAGEREGRAPSIASLWAASGYSHSSINLYTTTSDTACNGCHSATGTAPTFAALHTGYNTRVYKDATGARFDATIASTVMSASYDASSHVATITFGVTGVSTTAVVKPTIVGGLYGYDTKDFIVSGHNKSIDTFRDLEWSPGSTGNSARLTVTQGADLSVFTATLNLSSWASMIDAGQVKRIEVGFLPSVGQNPNAAVSATNLAVAVPGIAQTLDVTATKTDARISSIDPATKKTVWYKAIVDPAKCAKCHDALGSFWWHAPSNGSAGVVGCRLCHAVTNNAGYYEMQSRSIDSFLHGAHSMQMGEITKNLSFDPSSAGTMIWYDTHIEGNFPNFAGALNCEACHNPGTYDPPEQSRSLPALIGGTATVPGRTGVPTFAKQIVGPAARACGGCHRALALNELDGAKLAAFMAHTSDFGTAVLDATALVSTAAYLEYMSGVSATPVAAPAGAQLEQCTICHADAGSEHQALFNKWKSGL